MSVYLIVHTVQGPGGHGEPGDIYICLWKTGPYQSGPFEPAFKSLLQAEAYVKRKLKEDKWYRGKILELEFI